MIRLKIKIKSDRPTLLSGAFLFAILPHVFVFNISFILFDPTLLPEFSRFTCIFAHFSSSSRFVIHRRPGQDFVSFFFSFRELNFVFFNHGDVSLSLLFCLKRIVVMNLLFFFIFPIAFYFFLYSALLTSLVSLPSLSVFLSLSRLSLTLSFSVFPPSFSASFSILSLVYSLCFPSLFFCSSFYLISSLFSLFRSLLSPVLPFSLSLYFRIIDFFLVYSTVFLFLFFCIHFPGDLPPPLFLSIFSCFNHTHFPFSSILNVLYPHFRFLLSFPYISFFFYFNFLSLFSWFIFLSISFLFRFFFSFSFFLPLIFLFLFLLSNICLVLFPFSISFHPTSFFVLINISNDIIH